MVLLLYWSNQNVHNAIITRDDCEITDLCTQRDTIYSLYSAADIILLSHAALSITSGYTSHSRRARLCTTILSLWPNIKLIIISTCIIRCCHSPEFALAGQEQRFCMRRTLTQPRSLYSDSRLISQVYLCGMPEIPIALCTRKQGLYILMNIRQSTIWFNVHDLMPEPVRARSEVLLNYLKCTNCLCTCTSHSSSVSNLHNTYLLGRSSWLSLPGNTSLSLLLVTRQYSLFLSTGRAFTWPF